MRQLATAFLVACILAGCDKGEPTRPVKPLTQVPPTDYSQLRTPEDKIRYIENSKAPKEEKDRAIAQIRAGKL